MPPVLLAVFLLLASAVAIYLACEYFVNGIEWFGRRLNLSSTATGSVLAAFGTALPESAVTFVAVVFGRNTQEKNIGVGAALGGPLVLATISYSVVGLALLWNWRRIGRNDRMVQVDAPRLARDQLWFLAIFAVKVLLGVLVFSWKPWLGLLFVAAYGLYVWQETRDPGEAAEGEEELEPLKLRPGSSDHGIGWSALQCALALAVIAFASHLFVYNLNALSVALHAPSQLIALLLSPVATELPETMNALIWVRAGKERLALANISGAMMIQATVPSALGIFFTPWLLSPDLLLAAGVTALAIVILYLRFRRGAVDGRVLWPVGLLYGVFAAGVVWMRS